MSEIRGLTYQLVDILNELRDYNILHSPPGSAATIL